MAGVPPEGVPVDNWLRGGYGEGGKQAHDKFEEEFGELNSKSFERPERLCSKEGKEFPTKAYLVQGHGSRTYVASGGPTAATMQAFWELVVELKVDAISMLNGFELLRHGPTDENPQYWPLGAGEQLEFGPWTVRCVETFLKKTSTDNSHTLVDVQQSLCRVSQLVVSGPCPEPKKVVHVCHYKWRDGSIPESVNGKKAKGNAPQLVNLMTNHFGRATVVLVHCRAGVGRTGTAILLDICAARLLNTARADVKDTLEWVREQRPWAVQSLWQYVYVNVALARMALDRLDKKQHKAVFKIKGVEDSIQKCWKIMRKGMPKPQQ